MATLHSCTTEGLFAVMHKIRESWRNIPWPEDDVWPNEKLYEVIVKELKERGEL